MRSKPQDGNFCHLGATRRNCRCAAGESTLEACGLEPSQKRCSRKADRSSRGYELVSMKCPTPEVMYKLSDSDISWSNRQG